MSEDPSPPPDILRTRIAERHFISRVRQNSVARARNTVIEPWVDARNDVAVILAGGAIRTGNQLLVHGRTYGIEGSGTLYLIAGPGFRLLDRASFKALGVYNELSDTPQAAAVLRRMHDQTIDSRRLARAAYWAGERSEP